VLGAIAAEELCRRFPDADEGRLSRLKAQVVSRRSCAVVARRLGLGQRLAAHGRELGHDDGALLAAQRSVLAGLIEAVVGASFEQFGLDVIRPAVVAAFDDRIRWADAERIDHKTALQEMLQRQGQSVQYEVVRSSGPPHARLFESVALVDGRELGRGHGSSKKESEQEAARQAVDDLATGEDR
jgi:ribonuclease-3